MFRKIPFFFFSFLIVVQLVSCASPFGGVKIFRPDEHTRTFEAKEKIILKAIASILKEKSIGSDVTIDYANNRVDSDYVVSGEWRTKTTARVKRTGWKECEVTLSVTTEKKTEKGWEMRRLLEKDQYDSIFSVIDLRIYEEMSKVE
jgi:hypothetical protein